MKIELFFLILFICSNAFTSDKSFPTTPFIDKGACPFECCRYGDWIAKTAMDLTSNINGSDIVERVSAGEKIKALTGEVYTIPNEVEVIKDHNKFKRGDKIYLLTYQGEGLYRVWFNGKISSEEILFPDFTEKNDFKNCDDKKVDCWGKIINLRRNSVWWVKIQKANGSKGWTKQSKAFTGQDSCS